MSGVTKGVWWVSTLVLFERRPLGTLWSRDPLLWVRSREVWYQGPWDLSCPLRSVSGALQSPWHSEGLSKYWLSTWISSGIEATTGWDCRYLSTCLEGHLSQWQGVNLELWGADSPCVNNWNWRWCWIHAGRGQIFKLSLKKNWKLILPQTLNLLDFQLISTFPLPLLSFHRWRKSWGGCRLPKVMQN